MISSLWIITCCAVNQKFIATINYTLNGKILEESLLEVGRTVEIYPWDKKKVLKLFLSWCPTDCVVSEFFE